MALALMPAATAARADDSPFPEFEGLRGNVDFWVRVFGEWSRGQVAVHDLEYPGIVYEVAELPGPLQESYTSEQKDFVENLRRDWEGFLDTVADKVAAGTALEEIEQAWADYIVEQLGPEGLAQAHERVRTQRGLRERFRDGLSRAGRYEAKIREVFAAAGLPEDLAYLPHVESSFQYHAKSSAGATGLWQFTRSTGRLYMHIDSVVDERLDALAATRGAAAYLQQAYAELQSWPLALTSYNHGVQGMKKARDRFGTDFERIYAEYDGRLFGFASKNFYTEFLAARRIAQDPAQYFPEGYEVEPPVALDELPITTRTSPGSLARGLGVTLEELARLNPAWSERAVAKNLVLPVGTVVWLPAGALARAGGAAAAGAEERYVVRPGDTLSRIASEHGVRVRELQDANGMSAGHSLIRPGQELSLPLGAAAVDVRHVVRRGESLIRIATTYGVRLADLLELNTLRVDSVIHPGQMLRIPQ